MGFCMGFCKVEIGIWKKCANRVFELLNRPKVGVEKFQSVFIFLIGAVFAELWLDRT